MRLGFNLVPSFVVSFSSSLDMIDFVGTPPFLRIAFLLSMQTIFSHSPNKFFFYDKMFRKLGVPMKDMVPMRNCPVGCKVASN